MVGRPLIIGAFGGGSEGVKLILESYSKQLLQAMILTGVSEIKNIPMSVVNI